jgi:hypothetical protein
VGGAASPHHHPDGLARGYTLHTRPITYGETGVRSYFVGARGVLTVTAADRPATASDTPVLECEFDPLTPWRECAQVPDERRPHPTS